MIIHKFLVGAWIDYYIDGQPGVVTMSRNLSVGRNYIDPAVVGSTLATEGYSLWL